MRPSERAVPSGATGSSRARPRPGRLRSGFRLSRAEQLRALEAASLLTTAWIAVRLLPFRWYAPLLGRRGPPPTPAEHEGEVPGGDCMAGAAGDAMAGARGGIAGDSVAGAGDADLAARAVGRALRRAARHLPWRSTCLMRALAGKTMLRRRRCPATVFLGVARREGTELGFHAWIRAGGVWVSGGAEAPAFTVVATFR